MGPEITYRLEKIENQLETLNQILITVLNPPEVKAEVNKSYNKAT